MDKSAQFSARARGLITLALMSATLMQALDTTIVNVALPHMQGSLGATSNEISWVLTCYLVASAIMMPLTGYLTARLGQRKYLLISIGGFVLASILCGIATTISEIVFFRILQGISGAALVPLSQSILADIYPPEERGSAMAIWGVGVMVGPILGPTLGGYLTQVASWRWNFYINVPVGILCLIMTWKTLPETATTKRAMDWLGLGFISLSIGCFQFFLDRGNQSDWLNSTSMCIIAFLGIISFLCFMLNNLQEKTTSMVFDLSIFKDRNFMLASMLISLFGLGLYGTMVILPLMLENLFNYPVLTTGLVIAPRSVSGLISMLVVGKLIKYYDPRKLVLLGVIIFGSGMYISTYYNLDLSYGWVVGPMLLQGFGLGLVFVPLSAIAFSTLSDEKRAEASGLFSLLRTLGSSVGISVVSTLFVRHTQIAWNQLSGFITPYNPAVAHYLQGTHLDSHQPLGIMLLAKTLSNQAQMVSLINVFAFITGSFLVMLPLVLLIKKPKQQTTTIDMLAE